MVVYKYGYNIAEIEPIHQTLSAWSMLLSQNLCRVKIDNGCRHNQTRTTTTATPGAATNNHPTYYVLQWGQFATACHSIRYGSCSPIPLTICRSLGLNPAGPPRRLEAIHDTRGRWVIPRGHDATCTTHQLWVGCMYNDQCICSRLLYMCFW